MPEHLDDIIRLLSTVELGDVNPQNPGFRAELEAALAPDRLCAAFTDDSGECNTDTPGINLEMLRTFSELLENSADLMAMVVGMIQTHYKDLGSRLCRTPEDTTLLRTIPILLMCPAYRHPDTATSRKLIVDMAKTIISLRSECRSLFEVLVKWLKNDKRLLRRAVKVFLQGFEGLRRSKAYREIPTFKSYLQALEILYQINEENGCRVPRALFHVNSVLEKSDLLDLLLQFAYHAAPYLEPNETMRRELEKNRLFTWLDVPFVLNVRTKWTFLRVETSYLQINEMNMANEENFMRRQHNFIAMMNPIMGLPLLPGVQESLVFSNVERHRIVSSAIENVDKYWKKDGHAWLMPLDVRFGRGEYAVDAGGPSKEFFQILFEALMDTDKLSFFKKLDEKSVSSPVWFNGSCGDLETLEKIGLLFALLLFNGAIVTVPFPLMLYKLLLTKHSENSFEPNADLKELDPEFARKLEGYRNCSEEKLDAMNLDFGQTRPGGEHDMVTTENIELYIKEMTLQHLAVPQFGAFAKGFCRLARLTRLMWTIFKPEELRDVILGERFDWKELEKHTRYKAPYGPDHPVVERFWRVFHGLDESDKRKFLKFLTGADHVPIKGFESLQFVIRRLDTRAKHDAEPAIIMPEVMTCPGWISMDLPEYETDDDARDRLLKAIEMDLGFFREQPPQPLVPL